MRKILTAVALAAAAVPLQARAAIPNCSTVGPNQLWLQVGDTQEQLVKTLGRDLRASTAHPLTLVYVTGGSCTNVPNIQGGVKLTATMSYIPAGFDPSQASPTCTNDSGGHIVDVANAALFVSTCKLANTPTVLTSTQQGPNQAYTLVVPVSASPQAITAEEAYLVFGLAEQDGFDATTPLSPWNDHTLMFTRPSTKSTLLTWVSTLSVPGGDVNHTFTPALFKGTPEAASSDVVSHVLGSATPEKTIGLLGAEVFDAAPTGLKELAFQWFGQKHAYFPDSELGKHDKKNLRDGHYAVWSPTFWLQQVDASGNPTNPDADYLIKLILGQQQTFESNPLADVISVGLVPGCAMSVNRTVEGGPLSLFAPTEPCGCYYDSQIGTSSCTACSATAPCATGTCRNNFCEAR
jgi:hypothetical protein